MRQWRSRSWSAAPPNQKAAERFRMREKDEGEYVYTA
jgi:hypothetical protein